MPWCAQAHLSERFYSQPKREGFWAAIWAGQIRAKRPRDERQRRDAFREGFCICLSHAAGLLPGNGQLSH
jgi:hypothetical protein